MRLAIFDLDGTLVGNETLPFMLKAWGELGYSKTKMYKVKFKIGYYYILYKLKLSKTMDKQVFRSKAMYIFLELFKGLGEKEINDFFNQCFQMLEKDFKLPVLKELEKAKDKGYTTVLLSGGFKGFVDIVGRNYGFNHIMGSPIHYLTSGLINYDCPLDINMGSKKVEMLESQFENSSIDWKASKAYADSYYDLDILTKVGEPVAVSPDEKLTLYAHKHGWNIIK